VVYQHNNKWFVGSKCRLMAQVILCKHSSIFVLNLELCLSRSAGIQKCALHQTGIL